MHYHFLFNFTGRSRYPFIINTYTSLCRKLRNPRNRLHMHLFVSFIMRAFMALLKDWIFIDGIGMAWNVVFVDRNNAFINERSVKNTD